MKGQRRPRRRYQDKVHSEEERGWAESLGVGTLGCQKVLGQAGTHGTAMTGSWCPPAGCRRWSRSYRIWSSNYSRWGWAAE